MSETEGNSALEEAAGEQLGVERWDRPAIFRETADAATDNGLPYWLVLVLSGAIATLGLALNSSAVVIGAMLVAPLLSPVIGLALSLAVGDGRLAMRTGAVVVGSTAAVIAAGAILTVLLPFQTVTSEIAARARPTTLDLAIAIFSGLVGAVVTVARGSRLSAAIPGVAISVALIPPLAVAGFGVGMGWNGDLIRGSMLLYGANLAGIVLSGMAVFLLVGMHRSDVVDAARSWEAKYEPHGLAELASRSRWVRSIGVFGSARARIGMVGIFAIVLGFPLSESLGQIAREARVERAIDTISDSLFSGGGRASILNRQVVYGTGSTRVFLRVATTQWLGVEDRSDFEREVSALAEEPIRLTLEQIPARGEDLDQLAALFGTDRARESSAAPVVPPLPQLLVSAGEQLGAALPQVALPDGVQLLEAEVAATASGRPLVRLTYASAEPLPEATEEMMRRQLAASLELPDARVETTHVALEEHPFGSLPGDSAVLRTAMERLERYEGLGVEVVGPAGEERAETAADWLRSRVAEEGRVRVVRGEGEDVLIRIVPSSR